MNDIADNLDDLLLPEVETIEENIQIPEIDQSLESIEESVEEITPMNNDENLEDSNTTEEIDFNDPEMGLICASNWGDIGSINYNSSIDANKFNDDLLHKILNLDQDTDQIFSKFYANRDSCVKNIIYNSNNENLDTSIKYIEIAVLYYMIQTPTLAENQLQLFRNRSWDFIMYLNSIVEKYKDWTTYSFVMPYYQYYGKKIYKGYPVVGGYKNDELDNWPYTAPVTLMYMKSPNKDNNARVVIFVGVNNNEAKSSIINGLNSVMYFNFMESLKYGMVMEQETGDTLPDKTNDKHLVLTKGNNNDIVIKTRDNSVLELLNSEVLKTLYSILSTSSTQQDFELKSSLIPKKCLSPDITKNEEVYYYKSGVKKKINRFFGKISPYFIGQNNLYKNFYNYKLKQSEMSISQKQFYEYQNKGFQPLYPSLGYYLIGRQDEIKYKLKDPLSKIESPILDKMEHHTYLDNRIIKMIPNLDLKFSTTDPIKNNIRDYVYSVFKFNYENILGKEPEDKNSAEYKSYERQLKYVTDLYKADQVSIDSEIKDNKYYTVYNIKISLK